MQSSRCGLLDLVEVPRGLSYFHSYYKFILNVLEKIIKMYSTFFAVIQVSIGEIDRNSLKAKIMKPLFGLISFVLGCLWDWT